MQSQTSDKFPFHNGNDPAFCYNRPFSIDSESNTSPKQESNRDFIIPSPPPLSLFHFPSPPFEDPQIFLQQQHDFLLQFQHQPVPQSPEPQNTNEGCTKKSDVVPRKKSCKRDRHSKINTARGLRDRRMRLSLEVAKRFFGLQDMLGLDKASKTVEWLLNQAKGEINRLAKEKRRQKKSDDQSCNSGGSSECEEGVSSLDEVVVSVYQAQQEKKVDKGVKRTKVKSCSRKISAFHPLAKACRESARKRARERTREKMRNRGILNDESMQHREESDQDLSQLGSWNPFETGEESGAKSHSVNLSVDVITEAKEQSYHTNEHLGTLEEMAHDDDNSLIILSNKWSPSLIFNHYGFYQEHQFAEFQSLGKPWEA